MTGKRLRTKQQAESFVGVRDVFYENVDHLWHTRDKWLLDETCRGIIKDPSSLMAVWCNHHDRILASIGLHPGNQPIMPCDRPSNNDEASDYKGKATQTQLWRSWRGGTFVKHDGHY